MKGRLHIDTNFNTLSHSNILTENLKLFSTSSPSFDQNLKKKIFNNIINSKQSPNENINKNKFDTFKLNMLIKGRNSAASPQKLGKELSRNSGTKYNFNSTEWKDEIQHISQKSLHEKNEFNCENLFREKINNIKTDIFKLLSRNSTKSKRSTNLENFGSESKKSPTTDRLQRMKSSVNKFLERDFSNEKNLVKEKMKKLVENTQRESNTIKNLKNDLYKSASMKNKNDEFDDLYFSPVNRVSSDNKNFNSSSSNWNKNYKDIDYAGNFYGEEKTKSFGQTFSNFKIKSSNVLFAK